MLPITLAIGAGVLLTATLSCDALSAPGRLRCSLAAELPIESARIEWADIVVLRAPSFLQPLRGRLALREADIQKERSVRWTLALVAKAEGTGELVLRVRAVTCDVERRCAPTMLDVTAKVRVGPAEPEAKPSP